MTRIVENIRWRCNSCGGISTSPELLSAPNPFLAEDQITGCQWCRQCTEGFMLLCDEAGCERIGSCGWPTGNPTDQWGGYRTTCFEHRGTGE